MIAVTIEASHTSSYIRIYKSSIVAYKNKDAAAVDSTANVYQNCNEVYISLQGYFPPNLPSKAGLFAQRFYTTRIAFSKTLDSVIDTDFIDYCKKHKNKFVIYSRFLLPFRRLRVSEFLTLLVNAYLYWKAVIVSW